MPCESWLTEAACLGDQNGNCYWTDEGKCTAKVAHASFIFIGVTAAVILLAVICFFIRKYRLHERYVVDPEQQQQQQQQHQHQQQPYHQTGYNPHAGTPFIEMPTPHSSVARSATVDATTTSASVVDLDDFVPSPVRHSPRYFTNPLETPTRRYQEFLKERELEQGETIMKLQDVRRRYQELYREAHAHEEELLLLGVHMDDVAAAGAERPDGAPSADAAGGPAPAEGAEGSADGSEDGADSADASDKDRDVSDDQQQDDDDAPQPQPQPQPQTKPLTDEQKQAIVSELTMLLRKLDELKHIGRDMNHLRNNLAVQIITLQEYCGLQDAFFQRQNDVLDVLSAVFDDLHAKIHAYDGEQAAAGTGAAPSTSPGSLGASFLHNSSSASPGSKRSSSSKSRKRGAGGAFGHSMAKHAAERPRHRIPMPAQVRDVLDAGLHDLLERLDDLDLDTAPELVGVRKHLMRSAQQLQDHLDKGRRLSETFFL